MFFIIDYREYWLPSTIAFTKVYGSAVSRPNFKSVFGRSGGLKRRQSSFDLPYFLSVLFRRMQR